MSGGLLKRRAPPIVPSSGWAVWTTVLTALAMSFLAVLTLTAGLAADRLAETWRSDLAGAATVSLPPGERIEARTAAALEVLRTTPGVASARALTQEEHRALLTPWLGETRILDDLPSPRLIAVTLDPPGPDLTALQGRFDLTSPGARLDDHGAWRDPLASAATAVEGLAWAGTALVGLVAGGMVVLSVLATLAAQSGIVRVIRLIGGEDRYIISAVMTRMTLQTLAGAFIGTAMALGVLASVPGIAAEIGAIGVTETAVSGWLILGLGIPATAGALAWIATGLTVRIILAQRPR